MKMRVEGLDDLNRNLMRVAGKFEHEATQLVNRTAQNIRNTAVRSIQKPSEAGRTYDKYNPRRTHTASAPGSPPNTDTGLLAGSIRAIMSGKPTAYVDALANYAVHLEFGTRKMSARPFMTPAVEQERPKYERGLRELTRRAAK